MEYTKILWGVIALFLALNTANALPTSILQVNETTIGLNPGKTGVIILSFSNAGNDIAYDTRVVLKSIDPPLTSDSLCNNCLEYSNSQKMCLTFYDYCYTSVGDVYGGNGQDTSFKINVPGSLESGVYVIEFEIHYSSKNTTTGVVESRRMTRRLALNIESINVKPDVNLKSISTPSVINPGDKFNITIILENNGEVKAQEVNIILSTDDFKTKGKTNKVLIGDLDSGENKSVIYTLLADANIVPGVYEVGINTTYSDDENTYSKNSNTGLLIDGESEFNVFIQDISPDVIIKDSTINALISIANIGIINAKSVSIKINPHSDIELNSITEDFLGDLDTGDFTTTSFYFKPKNEGDLNINFTIGYTTPSGKRLEYIDTERIVIRYGPSLSSQEGISDQDNGSGLLSTVTNGFVIAAAIVFIYFFIKKTRK